MLFAAGIVVGIIIGIALAAIGAQAARGRLRPNATLATALSVLALVIAIIAVARSGQSPSSVDAASTTSSTTATPTPHGTDSSTTAPPEVVAVPNLIGLPQAVAVSEVQAQGLKADLQNIALSNVPSGYVVSQSPLAASRVPRGSTVVLMVSSPA